MIDDDDSQATKAWIAQMREQLPKFEADPFDTHSLTVAEEIRTVIEHAERLLLMEMRQREHSL